MAKKKIAEVAVEEPKVVAPPKKQKSNWEVKDRLYTLKKGLTPLTFTIKSKNIFWFDEEKGYERELKYSVNQKSCFVDEFKGDARLGHITFEDGSLQVPKSKQTLQKLLSLYHPGLNNVYEEFDAVEEAKDELAEIEFEIEALMIAQKMDVEEAESIVRVNVGSEVAQMTSKEIKRDLLVFAKQNPSLFLELAQDENIHVRNTGLKAVEQNIIKLSDDQRTFVWASNSKKLMVVPFDENPYSALAAWFKTDEGVEVYSTIEKRLK
mgnify:FL=1